MSHYGQNIVIEQCLVCGGVWFDKSEMHQIREGEAEKIEKLDLDMLQTVVQFQNKNLLCPKDQNKLLSYKDSFFPKDIIMEMCPVCDGFWLNKGEFTEYQKGRSDLQTMKESDVQNSAFEESIQKILEEHSSKDMTEAIGALGAFLSTPIDRHSLHPSNTSKKRTRAEELALNTVLNLVRFLV
jgi:Zn-finger nucleic acid-binding protein